MTLEGDDAAKKDTVLAHLINGYRVGESCYSIPGYTAFCDLGTGNVTVDGDYYSTLHDTRLAVSAGRIWAVKENGTKSELTGVSLTAGTPVVFAEDANAIYFVGNSLINKYVPGAATVSQLTGQAPINNTYISYISGFLVTNGADSAGGAVSGDTWYSDDTGYTTWEVFNNEAIPDGLQSLFATFNEIYAVGRESVEVSYLSGDAANPFVTNKGIAQPFGTPSRYSMAFDKQSIYFLSVIGDCRRLVRLVGGRQAEVLSFAVDVPIDDIADVSNARAWIQSWKGQSFYVVSFPVANITIDDMFYESISFAFNIRQKEWYIWGVWNAQKGQYDRYPADTFLYVEPWAKRFIGFNGVLWEMTGHKFDTTPVRMSIRTGNRNWGKQVEKISHEYVYDCKRGVGNSDIASPVFVHRWRDNGIKEWKNPRTISMGAVGDRRRPQKSRICGRYYERQDELIFADPCEVVFSGIEEEWTPTR